MAWNKARLLVLLLIVPASSALADAIPYPDPGTIAPQVITYASGGGGINVYFDGSGAAYTDFVQVYDVQTGYSTGDILDNHTTALGQEISVGTTPGQINAGDQLIFYIDSPEGLFASIASYSADGVNHAYITSYSGGMIGSTNVGSGLYVGLEDEPNGQSDFNYQDDTFVFTNVATTSPSSVTPEPSSIVLLGTGLLGFAGVVRRHFA